MCKNCIGACFLEWFFFFFLGVRKKQVASNLNIAEHKFPLGFCECRMKLIVSELENRNQWKESDITEVCLGDRRQYATKHVLDTVKEPQ